MRFLEFVVTLIKAGLLVFFAFLTLGAGFCGAFGAYATVVQGERDFGGAMAIVGCIVASVSGLITYGVWLSIVRSKPLAEPDRKE